MKKLLVTGLNGFVGGHLQALLATMPDGPWQLLESTPHDLLDCASLDAWLQDDCPDAIIHLAGQTFVPEAFRDPAQTIKVNLLGTLTYCRRSNAEVSAVPSYMSVLAIFTAKLTRLICQLTRAWRHARATPMPLVRSPPSCCVSSGVIASLGGS